MRRDVLLSFALLAAAPALAACALDEAAPPAHARATPTKGSGGTDRGGSGDCGGAGGSGGAPFMPAPHTPFPKLAPHAGTIFPHPRLVTLTFPGYAHEAEVQAFGDYVVTSPWLEATGAEYGVGPGTNTSRVLPDPAPAHLDDADLVALIGARIDDGTLPDGDADDGTLYMIYIPPGTTEKHHSTLCHGMLGYHHDATTAGRHVAYAVIGDCGGPITSTTSTAAHELIEAATDAYDGFSLDPPDDDPWSLLTGQETADLCEYLPDVYQDDHALQRSWSDVAAAAGGSPCVPIPRGEIYSSVSASPATVPLVAPGETATFTLTGWSTAPLDDWRLAVDDTDPYDFTPTWSLDAHSINDGRQVTLTLTVPPGTPSGQLGGVLLDSGPGYGRFWPVAVRVK